MNLSEALERLRLLAMVVYDQGTMANLSEEAKQANIEPLRQKRNDMIRLAIKHDLREVVIASEAYKQDAKWDLLRAKQHREKAKEAHSHSNHILSLLADDMKAKGETERSQNGYTATIVDGVLKVR